VDAPSNSTEKDTGVFEYTFDVVNTGNVEDTYSLTADSTGWSVETRSSISVEAGATEPVKVNVTIPSDAADGDSSDVTLTAESQDDSSVSDSGTMTVTYTPEDIEYELNIDAGDGGTTNPSPGTYTYSEGKEVSIEAIPDEGWSFSHWAGDYPSGEQEENVTTIVMDSNKSLTAYFEDINQDVEYELSISIEGGGTTEPVEGTHTYYSGEQVSVTANPEQGWGFSEWTGDYQSEEEEITITMDSNKSITAHFEELAPPDFKVEIIEYDQEVVEGEELIAEYRITNTGEEEGTQDIVFRVQDRDTDKVVQESLRLVGNESYSAELTWSPTSGDAGVRTLEVVSDDDTAQVNVTVLKPAEFELSELRAVPEEASVGEEVVLMINVTNLGDETGERTVEFYREGGESIGSDVVTVKGGETETASIMYSENTAGEYDIEVGDNTATATFEDEGEESSILDYWWLFVIIIVIAVILLGVLWMKKYRGYDFPTKDDK
ncbi:MAG: hypothetical protein KGY76_07325, partial [Candidatus Thermoplasmatota archaeon]|nr:hypothetical protein [Candidatus Thermoplasmatota archaeon]